MTLYGLFDFQQSPGTFAYHQAYLGMSFDPVYKAPQYDETTEPRFVFEAFKPAEPPRIEPTNFVYEETLSVDGEVTSRRVRDFSLIESFSN